LTSTSSEGSVSPTSLEECVQEQDGLEIFHPVN
jgi:hypothetical protein